MNYKPILIFIILLCAFTLNCTYTKIVSSWKLPNKNIEIGTLSKVLVVAFFNSNTAIRTAEDDMVRYLNGKGVAAYNYLSNNYNTNNTKALYAKLKQDNFDGAVTMRLVDIEQETTYTPSNVQLYPNYNRSFSSYYYRNWAFTNTPGYFATTKLYIVETNIYSLKDDKIIWTGTTQSTKPDGLNKMTKEIVKVIHQKMKKEKFITD